MDSVTPPESTRNSGRLSRRLRFEILRRDGHTCRYCGAAAPDATLTVDHVIPVVLGGGNEPNNLVTACVDCNGGKSSMPPDAAIVEDVDAAAMLFARAAERVAAQRRADRTAMLQTLTWFEDTWNNWTYSDGTNPALPGEWPNTVQRFVERGLSHEDLEYFIRVAMSKTGVRRNNEFRYFCGCCWREITTRDELARRLVEDGEI